MASSHPSSSDTPAPRRKVVAPRISKNNKVLQAQTAAAHASFAAGYSGTQTASHFVPVVTGSRTVYHEKKVDIPAPLIPTPSVSLPAVPGLVNWPDDGYARPVENHGGVPYVVREPPDDDDDDDDDEDVPDPGKVSWLYVPSHLFANQIHSRLPWLNGRSSVMRSEPSCTVTTRAARHT
jgi:hypothetical protein